MGMGKHMRQYVTIVTPETILKWFRKLVANKFDSSKIRMRHGRPAISEEIEQLIISWAKENFSWGYDRIVGALKNIGHSVCDTTVGNILKRHGIEPAPERTKTTTWKQFIKQQQHVLLATDFFTAEIWTKFGLATYYVLFFIQIESRKITVAGITQHPNKEWVVQCARNLTDWDTPFENMRYLIHDRDTKYTKSFDDIFLSMGIKPVKLPPRSPNLNAFAERFVRSINDECLHRLILFGEKSLKYVLKEYSEHYHHERNHQGKGNQILCPCDHSKHTGKIIKHERLGGLLNYYHRDAA